MSNIGVYLIPGVLGIIIITALFKKVPVFDIFLKGAGEGISSTFTIAPSLIGLLTAVSMLKASGALDIFTHFAKPLCALIGLPPQVVPLALFRPISGSGSMALLDQVLSNCGANSTAGRIASVIMGSTETTFYTLAVYFGSVKIKNSRHAVASALLADAAAIFGAIITVKLFMNKI